VGERDAAAEGHAQARDAARRASVRARIRRSNVLAANDAASSVSVRCECGSSCGAWLVVESEVFARVSTSRRFLVAIGHHEPKLERVVLKRRDYEVIERRPSSPARP
jgi:hypothetical protein